MASIASASASTSSSSSGIPFMELYRPQSIDNIVLDPLNKQMLKNIIDTSYFPNLLFYGPPGTGKTTTIINLINAYQDKLNKRNRDLIIHLNASDERGIDIIRNQINFFVNSNPLFNHGMKFVILDEVDYMTKNAQQALRYLLQNYTSNVRFCLICNYISKIDEGLQNEFIKLRFNQLPRESIISFLDQISVSENLQLSTKTLSGIQKLFKSDIRSMINFMQSNQDMENDALHIMDNEVWDTLREKLARRESIASISQFIYTLSVNYNIDKKNIIKDFLDYIIRSHPKYVDSDFLNFVENLMHSPNQNNKSCMHYSISQLSSFLSK
jgi:DNA polymerase III delta prime subunit